MFFTYVLQSLKDGKFYIGHAENVTKRLAQHNAGRVSSTKRRVPFRLLHKQEFFTKNEARWQEKKWKTAWGHKQLAKIISPS
ncbi:MAG: GIY-YIG nuclease family protein [Candidatus Omnitrophota bacterium]|jgi:putative endonuclease